MIHYPWHPWAGQNVRLVLSLERASERCFRVDRVVGGKTKRMDIPAWMFDRANCAIMIKHEVPHVTVSTLCGLGELLRSSVPQAVFK